MTDACTLVSSETPDITFKGAAGFSLLAVVVAGLAVGIAGTELPLWAGLAAGVTGALGGAIFAKRVSRDAANDQMRATDAGEERHNHSR